MNLLAYRCVNLGWRGMGKASVRMPRELARRGGLLALFGCLLAIGAGCQARSEAGGSGAFDSQSARGWDAVSERSGLAGLVTLPVFLAGEVVERCVTGK